MRLLDLFSGTKSVSKAAQTLGWETISLDIDPKFNPDLCMDIMDFDQTQFPKDHFDFVWASPDCRAYSIARTNAKIDRETAMEISDKLVDKTIKIIQYFTAPYCIENPATSKLWKRDVINYFIVDCCVTSYCRFGAAYRKNTTLANNFKLILPKCQGVGQCPAMIGKKHKEHAQKGCGGCASSYKHTDELHVIPEGLILEILNQLQRHGYK